MPTPEQTARERINALLTSAGWQVQDAGAAYITAVQGVAIREFALQTGHGTADYLLYVNGRAAGVIEAKKEGHTLSGVETQSTKYSEGLPPALPFAYRSTGVEMRFTNGLDPEPRSRSLFAFHRPELLTEWLSDAGLSTASGTADAAARPPENRATFLARLRHLPPLIEEGLWPAHIKAIRNLERFLRENRLRALIQMATGSGKTHTAITFNYRLIKLAGARRVLFLVDRCNLADQALKEFQQYPTRFRSRSATPARSAGSSSTTTSPTTPTSSTATWSPRTRSAPSSAPSAQAVHRDLPRPAVGTEDPDLRQGRRPRREHRRDRARGLRPEDHLPHRRCETDIKAVEVVMFMRAVKSRAFFEQMKGRGVRVIKPDSSSPI